MAHAANSRFFRMTISAVLLMMAAALTWAVNLTGAGATFPYPLYTKWFDVYAQKGVQINYQSIGSGGGIKQLQASTVDFGASDAPLSDEEMKTMPRPVVHLPMVAGAVVIVYNLPNVPRGLRMNADVVSGIYLGQITMWNDRRIGNLNPKVRLPNMPITVVHRSDGSGTSFIYTNYLSAVNNNWKTKVGVGKSVNWPVGLGGKGNEGVAGVVQQSPGGIGYVELAYAVQTRLAYAFMQNKSGQFIEPSIASTTAAAAGAIGAMQKDVRVSIVNSKGHEAYPIAGFTYILIYKNQLDQAKGKTVVDFLRWASHEGQVYAGKLLYAPLPQPVAKMNDSILKTVVCNGRPLLK